MKSREELREYHRQWAARNRDKTRAYSRKSYAKMTDEDRRKKSLTARPRFLRKNYGITEADFDRMLVEQGGTCALCRDPNARCRYGRLNVDHCHETGRVRGLLCSGCNVSIAALGDNAEGLARALAYVRGELVKV